MTLVDPPAAAATSGALAAFEAHRARLFGIAYRMLGSAADADDCLQEARVRWLAADRAAVADVRAYLVTIVSRLALDQLGSARARREVYVGPWLPEPIATAPDTDAHDLSLAFLHLLERLSPAERAAFLLAEVFDYSHAEVAAILGKSEAACRQLAARARAHVRAGRPDPAASADRAAAALGAGTDRAVDRAAASDRTVDRAAHERMLAAFMAACAGGDLAGLERLLAADVVVLSDGGGRVTAARNPVIGPHNAARLLIGLTRKGGAALIPQLATINGLPALLARRVDGTIATVVALDLAGDRIAAVYLVSNPDKLTAVTAPRALA